MDWVKIGAVAVSVGTGIEKMMKVYRHVRAIQRAAIHGPAPGVTVMNGEYKLLRADLEGIKAALQLIAAAVTRTDSRLEQVAADTASRIDAHARRLLSLEQRQSNQAG